MRFANFAQPRRQPRPATCLINLARPLVEWARLGDVAGGVLLRRRASW